MDQAEKLKVFDLPTEILHKIFAYLDNSSLKNVSIVNKRFAEVFANSSILLKKFKLVLSSDVWQSKWKLPQVLSFKRNVYNIEIHGNAPHADLMRVFQKFGMNLKSCSFFSVKIDDFTLREVLKTMDNLESLKFSEVAVVKKLPANFPVSMRKLKNFTIYHCDWGIINFLTAQLRSIDVKSFLDEGSSRKNFLAFLKQQKFLEELSLRGTSARILFQQSDIVKNCVFGLQKFRLEFDFGKNSDNVNWHLTTFLSLHVDSLKNIEIIGPNCQHVSGFVIANMENLEVLSLDARGLPKEEEFYELLENEKNFNLKELSLRGFFIQNQAIQKVLLKYPAIERLELNDWRNANTTAEMLDFVSKNFPNLKKLSVNEISTGEDVKFSGLSNLTVNYIRNTRKLKQFIMKNSSVNTLRVGLIYIGQVTEEFIQDVKDLKNVKHLAFGGNGNALTNIFEMMKREDFPRTLKTLELLPVSSEKSSWNSGKSAKFYFPIEKNTKLFL